MAALDTMFGGFRERADRTYQLLKAPGTAFVVVAAPERDALREAAYFVERLAADEMPLAGLVLNRVHGTGAPQLTAERALAAAQALEDERCGPRAAAGRGGRGLAAGLLRLHAERMEVMTRRAAHPGPLRLGLPRRADRRGAGPGRRRARPDRAAPDRPTAERPGRRVGGQDGLGQPACA